MSDKKTAIAAQKGDSFFSDLLKTDVRLTSAKDGKDSTALSKNILSTQHNENLILDISPKAAKNWRFHDRLEVDMGDLEALARDMKLNGQIEPCIARKHPQQENGVEYEIIAGERRWHAAHKADMTLKIIVKSLSDEQAAIIQAAENLNRQGLSDYSIGMSYAKLLSTGTLKQVDLIEKIGRSKLQVNRYMAFSQIPSSIWDAISNPSKISTRTAAEIRALSKKGDQYINAIIQLAPKIQNAKIGANNLKKEVEKLLNSHQNSKTALQKFTVSSESGALIKCTFNPSKHQFTFVVPKTLSEKFDAEAFTKVIKQFMRD